MTTPIYVVVTGDNMSSTHRKQQAERGIPYRRRPVIWETDITQASLDDARRDAARFDALGYGPCHVAMLVFEDHPAFVGGIS